MPDVGGKKYQAVAAPRLSVLVHLLLPSPPLCLSLFNFKVVMFGKDP